METDSNLIIIHQLPEKIISVKVNDDHHSSSIRVQLGHIIGNRHRPISIKNESISFPIHDDSEMELFERLFHEVIDKIDLSIEEQRFIPHVSMDVHEH